MYLWYKRVAPTGADLWIQRLRSAVDPARVVMVSPAAGRSVRLEIYCDGAKEGAALAEHFGGQVREVPDQSWQPLPATLLGKPLRIGGSLLVTGHTGELAPLRKIYPNRGVLCIPAAMAFGTGEHATTAMCLRFLSEIARRRTAGSWDLLDLGTGSGILALAGKLFGAGSAVGLDNDPHAVRTARENARLNGVSTRSARFARADLIRWRAPERQVWPVVTANLFSELLIRLMPEVIAPAVAPGGDLILSGVLATQADEVIAAIRGADLSLIATARRGRWRAFHCRRN